MNDILTEQSGGILRITLNRPARKNAMTGAMYAAIADLLNAAATDDAVRVVLWHGAGDSFTAGNDIEDFLVHPPVAEGSPQAHLMHALVDFNKPLVAAVHGAAIGGGATMLTHFDFIYAAENTTFQLPFVDLGLVPEFGSSATLPARFGHPRAAELFMLAHPFSAAKAAALGLVTRVVPDQEVLAAAMDIARQLAAKPAEALQATKRLLKRPFSDARQDAIRAENDEFAVRIVSTEARQAMNAFLQMRSADRKTATATAAA